MPSQNSNLPLILSVVLVIIVICASGAGFYYYLSRQNAPANTPPTDNSGSFQSIDNGQTSAIGTSAEPASGTTVQSASATFDQKSLTATTTTPTITGTFSNTTGIEILIAKGELPKRGFLTDIVAGMVWDDYSDHNGGVILSTVPNGSFSNTISTPLIDGTYNIGVYIVTYNYPETDENRAQDYRRLLTSGTLVIHTTKS